MNIQELRTWRPPAPRPANAAPPPPSPSWTQDELTLDAARTRARAAYRNADRPLLGADFNQNPGNTAVFQAAAPTTDLQAAGRQAATRLRAATAQVANRGYAGLRTELWADALPEPAVAAAYELWRANGTFANGRTPAAFRQALASPTFQAQLARRGLSPRPDQVDDDAVIYLELTLAQLKAIPRMGPKVNLVLGLGEAGLPAGPGRFEPDEAAAAYVAGVSAKVQYLAMRARRAGVEQLELGNEPNLGTDPAFWRPDPQDGRSITNAARRHAYLSGTIYQALKADPTLAGLAVTSAAMAFTNPVPGDDPFYPMETVPDRLDELLPGAEEPERQAFARHAKAAADAEVRGDTPAVCGHVDALWAIYDRNRQRRDPGYDPLQPHRNDAIAFLREMAAAQREYFGQGLLTDRTNLHLYGSPVRNALLLDAYGQLADEGLAPRDVVVTEFGDRTPDPTQQATALFDQAATILDRARQDGLAVRMLETFCFPSYEGWGVGRNPAYDAKALAPAHEPSFRLVTWLGLRSR